MEGRKEEGGSTFSFNSDVFGTKDSSSSLSTGIFTSMFAPSPKEIRKETLQPEEVDKKQNPGINVSDTRAGPKDNDSQSSEPRNAYKSSYYQQECLQPCPLSCSIYYGGQEMYPEPSASEGDMSQSAFKKDEVEDDGFASRGNWWKGSLYY